MQDCWREMFEGIQAGPLDCNRLITELTTHACPGQGVTHAS